MSPSNTFLMANWFASHNFSNIRLPLCPSGISQLELKKLKKLSYLFMNPLLEFQLSLHSNSEGGLAREDEKSIFRRPFTVCVLISWFFQCSQLKLSSSLASTVPPPFSSAQHWRKLDFLFKMKEEKAVSWKMVFESAHYKRQEDDEESSVGPPAGRHEQQVPEVKMAMVRIHSTDVC